MKSRDTTPTAAPVAAQADGAEVCFEVAQVLDGFLLTKRSETLDGSVPLRAAQGCKPLLDGNSAGFHLRFADPAVIRRGRGGPKLTLTDEGFDRLLEGYDEKLEAAVARGLLERGGYWHRKLRKGFARRVGDKLRVWTGLLVRPAQGVWLLVTGAYNRRCLVNVEEYVVADDSSFVPVILDLDFASLRSRDTWLDTELACLLPLRPGVEFSVGTLADSPEVGRAWCDFYDRSYIEARAEVKYTARYRRVTARESAAKSLDEARCRLVVLGGPNLHRVGTFDRFATGAGLSRTHPLKNTLQFAVVRNVADVRARWDGSNIRDVEAEVPGGPEPFLREWAERYGPETLHSVELFADYVEHNSGPYRGEPYFSITPWVFATTPPGWSSLMDSYHLDGLDGMRGVISTDTHFGVASLWQLSEPRKFAVAKGTPLLRVLPVPRQLLRATFKKV